jgi:RNA polymerase sigma-70 factor (ECF subfamily)
MKATTTQRIAEQSEIQLLEQARDGNAAALEELYLHYLKGCGAIKALLRKALPREQREDMLHEIFLQLISGRHPFRGEAQLKTYVYQIARVTIFQKYRKENTFKRGKAFRIISESNELRDSERTNPESKYCLKEAQNIIRELIEELPSVYKDALRLRVVNDFSYEEIAEEMSLPLNTVSTKIHKGKKLLSMSSRQHDIRDLLRVF